MLLGIEEKIELAGTIRMSIDHLPGEHARQFLIQLYEMTRGDSSEQASMYDIGQAMGLERDVTSRTAEELIGEGLVEIRTLSGGIGITAEGVARTDQLKDNAQTAAAESVLGHDRVLDSGNRQALEEITLEIKQKAGGQGMDFDALSQLVADLRTMDAQLASPRPRVGIFRESLDSICQVLESNKEKDLLARVRRFIGN